MKRKWKVKAQNIWNTKFDVFCISIQLSLLWSSPRCCLCWHSSSATNTIWENMSKDIEYSEQYLDDHFEFRSAQYIIALLTEPISKITIIQSNQTRDITKVSQVPDSTETIDVRGWMESTGSDPKQRMDALYDSCTRYFLHKSEYYSKYPRFVLVLIIYYVLLLVCCCLILFATQNHTFCCFDDRSTRIHGRGKHLQIGMHPMIWLNRKSDSGFLITNRPQTISKTKCEQKGHLLLVWPQAKKTTIDSRHWLYSILAALFTFVADDQFTAVVPGLPVISSQNAMDCLKDCIICCNRWFTSHMISRWSSLMIRETVFWMTFGRDLPFFLIEFTKYSFARPLLFKSRFWFLMSIWSIVVWWKDRDVHNLSDLWGHWSGMNLLHEALRVRVIQQSYATSSRDQSTDQSLKRIAINSTD